MIDLVRGLDTVLGKIADLFKIGANLCLLLMLALTAVTIVIRPLGLSIWWLWPWSMQVFVWMSFLGFFAVYRAKKDIAVDFVMRRLGPGAMTFSRYFSSIMIILVTGVILTQMPKLLETQVGVIDGVVTPWGWQLERYTLTWPLAVSSAFILLNSVLDIAKGLLGWPEQFASQAVSADE